MCFIVQPKRHTICISKCLLKLMRSTLSFLSVVHLLAQFLVLPSFGFIDSRFWCVCDRGLYQKT